MQSLKILLASAAVVLGTGLPALASSSVWYNSEGGKVRLVTSGKPDEAGRIQGVLDIALKPGWKTYWRDPGDAGVPPQIDISASTNISDARFSFPPPQRHDDGYGKWAGYDHPVSLPITFTLSAPDQSAVIDANIFLGICETICIPVQTRLSVDPGADPDNAKDAAQVKAAFATLPAAPRPDFGINVLPGDHETLIVEASFPGDPEAADFFVAGERDYMFGAPVRSEKDGKLLFTVPILDRPSTTPTDGGLYYTLTSAEGAVEGVLPFP
ncbi:hypothetical protein D3227_11815 [Mesorhizobium waimense]|uniref:Thiol:disulfide interchange protein DsbD N-terminal domain-containing protein n=1 Tax=Mesorhizobium waimense TaxID=1300307 RepID=A0A3A5KUJ7_9HYPH|nr:protein-disulfide reductase DsbD domain-containing protein [Mesorhizobium waimense]RJT40115.1 hypothetical protein D3227_11815 [Mesorhizobium waimense]